MLPGMTLWVNQYKRDPHHLFSVTAPTCARWIRVSSHSRKSRIFSKENSVSALLTLCPGWFWYEQWTSYLAPSTSSSFGDAKHLLRPYLSWGQGLHSNRTLKIFVSDHQGTSPTIRKRSVSRQCYWAHKQRPPETRKFLRQHWPRSTCPRHLQRQDWQSH